MSSINVLEVSEALRWRLRVGGRGVMEVGEGGGGGERLINYL